MCDKCHETFMERAKRHSNTPPSKEVAMEFGQDLAILLEFAACVTGKNMAELSVKDLAAYSVKQIVGGTKEDALRLLLCGLLLRSGPVLLTPELFEKVKKYKLGLRSEEQGSCTKLWVENEQDNH